MVNDDDDDDDDDGNNNNNNNNNNKQRKMRNYLIEWSRIILKKVAVPNVPSPYHNTIFSIFSSYLSPWYHCAFDLRILTLIPIPLVQSDPPTAASLI